MEYQEHLKPILQQQFQNKWPDPADAKSIKEFHKQYSEQYGKAMAYKELFNMLAGASKVAQNLAKQINNPEKDYGLGTTEGKK